MIIKGGSRAAPGQLAWHLQRLDTNDKVEILEIQFPTSNLAEAFRDWQTISEGTRGFKGLYHANIDPAMDYTMTREQWQHAVDVLEKELKLEGQPRAVVMHEKLGREHLHVVWARTDIDTMTLCSDSQNYLAHERASQRLENEFGHEPVPGKHAKRDREQQPEFPRAEANQAEWQQGERTGIDPAARKDQITALKEACDNAWAFKVALEEQGYILAKGDRRNFVIVDETGSIHSLGRQIRDIKDAELRAFMKPIDRETLPTPAEAKDLQQQRRQQAQQQPQQPAQQQPQPPELSPAEPPPEPQQPEHSHQQEPSHYDYIDHEEQLRRQHQAPEPPQPPDESQERPPKSRRSETPGHYPYQPNVDGLGAIIEVAVTPLTEALRAILDYRSARKGEFPDDEASRRKQAASAQTPRHYPRQPDIDGLGAIIEVAVTPLTEALRAILDYRSARKREFPDDEASRRKEAASAQTPRHYPKQPDIDGLGAIIEVAVMPLTEALRAILADKPGKDPEPRDEQEKRRKKAASAQTSRHYPNQPDVDGLGAIIEVAVTPLTEAVRAILDYRSARKREPKAIQQDQPEADARREERELSTALTRFFGAIRDFFLPDRAVGREAERPPQEEESARHQRQGAQQQQQSEPSPEEAPPEPPPGSSSESSPEPPPPQQQEPKEEEHHQQPEDKPADKPSEPAPDPNQARNEALRKALAERQAEEGRQLVESQRAEMDQLRQSLDHETREKLDYYDANHRAQTAALRREQEEASAGFMDAVQDFFNPARVAERKAERQSEVDQLAARLKQERDDYVALLQQTNALEIHNREELHALRLHDLEVRAAEERERYLREQELARKLEAENEERERQLALQRARDGPKRTQ